jgi:hypothetical protein
MQMLTQTSKVVIEDLLDMTILPEADSFQKANDRNMTKPWFLQKVPSPISIEDIINRFTKGVYRSYTQVLADVDLMVQQRLLVYGHVRPIAQVIRRFERLWTGLLHHNGRFHKVIFYEFVTLFPRDVIPVRVSELTLHKPGHFFCSWSWRRR